VLQNLLCQQGQSKIMLINIMYETRIFWVGWSQKLAKQLGFSWFDVCDIIWRAKHHKQPEFKEILIFSVIRKNLTRIKSGKPLRDIYEIWFTR